MIFIAHRINTIIQLKKVPAKYGVEVDVRDYNGTLILNHDPFTDGERLDEFLNFYNHKIIIFNIKSERIEHSVLKLIKKHKIKNYFFLDSSFPMIFTLSKEGEKNSAIRFSEFEPIEEAVNMSGLVKWIWIDCFSKFPVGKTEYFLIKKLGFKTCLVSPELQGRSQDIEIYNKYIRDNNMVFDAVCTKFEVIKRWH